MKIDATVTDTALLTITRNDGSVFIFPRGLLNPDDDIGVIKAQAEAYINPHFVNDGRHFRVNILSTNPIDFYVWSGPLDQEPEWEI